MPTCILFWKTHRGPAMAIASAPVRRYTAVPGILPGIIQGIGDRGRQSIALMAIAIIAMTPRHSCLATITIIAVTPKNRCQQPHTKQARNTYFLPVCLYVRVHLFIDALLGEYHSGRSKPTNACDVAIPSTSWILSYTGYILSITLNASATGSKLVSSFSSSTSLRSSRVISALLFISTLASWLGQAAREE